MKSGSVKALPKITPTGGEVFGPLANGWEAPRKSHCSGIPHPTAGETQHMLVLIQNAAALCTTTFRWLGKPALARPEKASTCWVPEAGKSAHWHWHYREGGHMFVPMARENAPSCYQGKQLPAVLEVKESSCIQGCCTPTNCKSPHPVLP